MSRGETESPMWSISQLRESIHQCVSHTDTDGCIRQITALTPKSTLVPGSPKESSGREKPKGKEYRQIPL